MNRIEELKQKRMDVGLDDAEAEELERLLADEPASCDTQPSADAAGETQTGGLLSRVFTRRMRAVELGVIGLVVLASCVWVSSWWFSPPSRRVPIIQGPMRLVPTIVRADAGVTVERGETTIPGQTEFELQADDVLLTVEGAGAAIQYEDTTSVALSPGTLLIAQPAAEAERRPNAMLLRLENGTLISNVAIQTDDRSFVILTPNARVEVVGTRFTTTADKESTRVEVREGRVELTRVDDGKSVTISAGQYAVAAKGTDLAARASKRAAAAPIALYRFDEGQGDRVHDASGFGEPLDLAVSEPQMVRWFKDGGLLLIGHVCLSSEVPARKIWKACRATNQLTVEAWISPSTPDQRGPAQIVSLSADDSRLNFTLAHGSDADEESAGDQYVVRVRTTETDNSGRPATATQPGIAISAVTHVVATYSLADGMRIYTDGVLRAEQKVGGDFSGWDAACRLLLGDEPAGGRPWLGTLYRVSIYDRAFTAAEVQQSFAAGPQQ